jgi:hypothetical protein
MTDVKEQQIFINFCSSSVRQHQKHKMLKETFDDNALGLTQTYERLKQFKKKRMDISRR